MPWSEPKKVSNERRSSASPRQQPANVDSPSKNEYDGKPMHLVRAWEGQKYS
jgi:hypothetical protein